MGWGGVVCFILFTVALSSFLLKFIFLSICVPRLVPQLAVVPDWVHNLLI